MTSIFAIMGLAAIAALIFIWCRDRSGAIHLKTQIEPGRGIIGEAATALEVVADQIINGGRQPGSRAREIKTDNGMNDHTTSPKQLND